MSSQEDINPESGDSPSKANSKDAMFEPKPKPKMVRVLTVVAYVLSVSMAAILLSIYYIFIWDGKPHIGARKGFDIAVEEERTTQGHRLIHSPDNSKRFEYLDLLNNTVDSTIRLGGTLKEKTIFGEEGNNTNTEMQQQFTANEFQESPATSATTVSTTTTEDDYENFEEFKKSTTFMKKLVYRYDENY